MASSVLLLLLSLLYRHPDLCDSIYAEGRGLLRLIEDVAANPFNGRDGGGPCWRAEAECADGRRVVAFIWSKKNFYGAIPVAVRDFQNLQIFDLGHYKIRGALPPGSGSISSHEILVLRSGCYVNGISPKLHKLDMLSELLAGEKLSSANRESISRNSRMANSRRLLQVVGKEIGRYHKHEKHHAAAPVSFPSSSLLPRKLRFPSLPMQPCSLSNSSVVFRSPGSSPLSTTSSPSPSNNLITHAPPPSLLNGTPSSSPRFTGSKLIRQLNALVSNPSSPEGSVSLLGTTPLTKHPSWVLYTSIAGGVSCLFVVSSIYIFFCRANKIVTVIPLSTGLSGQLQKALVTGVPSLGRPELERACEDFSNVIGTLSECVFYKGTLSTGVEIAVASTMITSSRDWSAQSEAQFRKKISVLSKLNHKNFMNLLGFCEGEEPFTRMMVFEYAPNGTLFEHLHIREAEHLDWAMRLRIAMGVAYCLEHMHQLNPPVVLRNLHSSTVYLTDDYAAMISDIGFLNDGTESGTLDGRSGLTDASQPTPESDVYKFGIIILEMISGRRPFSEDDGLLVLWASSYLTGSRPLKDMVDPTLESFSEEDVRLLCEVIRPCINPDPRERPTMTDIVGRLRRITSMPPDGATPKPSPLWWAELEIISTEVT